MIRPMHAADVPAVAALHCARLTGLLARLGKPAVTAWYRTALDTGEAVGLVSVNGGELEGFVLGAVHPAGLRASVVRLRPVAVLGSTLLGILRRPTTLPVVLRSRRGPPPGAYNPEVPELIYLATTQGQQGSGVGKALMAAFSNVMRGCGVAGYELSVDEGNTRAITFYERAGLRQVGAYDEFGVAHRRYRCCLNGHRGTE